MGERMFLNYRKKLKIKTWFNEEFCRGQRTDGQFVLQQVDVIQGIKTEQSSMILLIVLK